MPTLVSSLRIPICGSFQDSEICRDPGGTAVTHKFKVNCEFITLVTHGPPAQGAETPLVCHVG